MDPYDRQFQEDVAEGLRIGAWLALALVIAAGMAIGAVALTALPNIAAAIADPLAGSPY